MTKNYFKNIADKLDEEKFSIYGNGIAFTLTYVNRDEQMSHRMIGMGTGEDMAIITLIGLRNLYEATGHKVAPEEFIDSVKENFLRFIASDFPFGGDIHVFGTEEGE